MPGQDSVYREVLCLTTQAFNLYKFDMNKSVLHVELFQRPELKIEQFTKQYVRNEPYG